MNFFLLSALSVLCAVVSSEYRSPQLASIIVHDGADAKKQCTLPLADAAKTVVTMTFSGRMFHSDQKTRAKYGIEMLDFTYFGDRKLHLDRSKADISAVSYVENCTCYKVGKMNVCVRQRVRVVADKELFTSAMQFPWALTYFN